MPTRSTQSRSGGFIWFAAQDWWYHNQAHSDFQLMKEVSRTQPVLIVNSLGLRMPTLGNSSNPLRRVLRKLRSMTKLLRRPLADLPRFYVMTPIMIPSYGDGRLARFNAKSIRFQVRLAARIIGLPAEPVIGVTIPSAWPVVEKMARSALVFNRSDLHSAFPEADSGWVESLESHLLERSDHVLYVSHELMKRDVSLVGDRAYFLDHGVDLNHFSRRGPVHSDIEAIAPPRIGFFGGLDDYVVDMSLLLDTARRLPHVNLILIGDATCRMDELSALPNVHWLGFRDYQEIPSLGRGFDVALMPWLDNEWIRFANPIKLKEYLALGLPVVSTEYPEVEAYRDQIVVARDRESFVGEVEEALAAPGDAEARETFVQSFSWAGRATALMSLVARR